MNERNLVRTWIMMDLLGADLLAAYHEAQGLLCYVRPLYRRGFWRCRGAGRELTVTRRTTDGTLLFSSRMAFVRKPAVPESGQYKDHQ